MAGKGFLNKKHHKGSNVMGEEEAKAGAVMRQEWRDGVSNTAPVGKPQAYTPSSAPSAYVPASNAQAFAPPGGQGQPSES